MATTYRSLNIIKFADQELHFKLFPVQRVLLKMLYGLPLDNESEFVVHCNGWGQPASFLTEEDYAKLLFEQGRTNYKEGNTGPFQELVLPAGRRGGKTQLSAIILDYEIYKTLGHDCPQKYYGMPPSNTIQFLSLATDKDQAGLLYRETNGLSSESLILRDALANNTQSYARFQTNHDIATSSRFRYDPTSAKATLKLTFKSCIAKDQRGASNLIVVLDEAAHFANNGQASLEAIYHVVCPSVFTFTPKDPNTLAPSGLCEGKILVISSPLQKQGLFYQLFNEGMTGKSKNNRLCVQLPTWELNPSIPLSELQNERDRDPIGFYTEYGAEFYPIEKFPYNVEGEALVNGELKTNVVFRVLGEEGIVVQKNPRGGWIVTTGNVA